VLWKGEAMQRVLNASMQSFDCFGSLYATVKINAAAGWTVNVKSTQLIL